MKKYFENPDFEPSKITKIMLVYLAKMEKKLIDVIDYKFPGLFGHYIYRQARAHFFVAVAIEIITIVVMFGSLENNALLGIPFVLDVIFSVFAYFFVKGEIVNHNYAILAKEGIIQYGNATTTGLERTFKSLKRRFSMGKWFFHSLLVFIVLTKSVFIFGRFPGTLTIKLVLVAVSVYVLWVHVSFTAQYLYEKVFRIFLARDIESFENETDTPYKVIGYRYRDVAGATLKEFDPKPNFNHKVEKYGNNQRLYIWGMLTDENITTLQDTQDTPEQKKIIALQAMKLQIDGILRNDPVEVAKKYANNLNEPSEISSSSFIPSGEESLEINENEIIDLDENGKIEALEIEQKSQQSN